MVLLFFYFFGEKCENACERILKIYKGVVKMEGIVKGLGSSDWSGRSSILCGFFIVFEDRKLEL